MDRYEIGQDLKCDNEHITIDRNGNEYTITADADPSTLTGALRCVKSVKGIDAKYPLLAFTTGQEAPGYADSNHLQSVIWGAADPVSIYINFGKGTAPPAEGAPELPLFSLTAEKVDLNPGFDGDVHSGMGDAALNSTVNCSVNNNNSIVYNQDMVMTKVAGGRMRFTAAETLARDTTDAATVNIRITGIENDALPDVSKTIIQEGEPSHILEITKADMETGETLPGAEFEILNSDHGQTAAGNAGSVAKRCAGQRYTEVLLLQCDNGLRSHRTGSYHQSLNCGLLGWQRIALDHRRSMLCYGHRRRFDAEKKHVA